LTHTVVLLLTHQLVTSSMISAGGSLKNTGEARETSFLYQRISILVQRFSAVLLRDSLPVTDCAESTN